MIVAVKDTVKTTYYLPIIISILFLTLIVNYLDRTAIAFAITPIQQEFHLDNAQFGAIGAAFGFGYLFMTVVGGILVDKFKAYKVLSVSAMLWSLFSILLALATGFWMIIVVRIFLGVTEGPCFPAVTRVIADWMTLKNRVKTMALCLAAVPFASVIGAPLISYLISWFNWRITYAILGAVGLLLALLWYIFYRDAESKKDQHVEINWRALIFNRALMASNVAYFAYGYLLFFALLWLPGYLEQTYGIQLKQIGWFLTAPWLVGTIFLLCGGFLSDKLLELTGNIRMLDRI